MKEEVTEIQEEKAGNQVSNCIEGQGYTPGLKEKEKGYYIDD